MLSTSSMHATSKTYVIITVEERQELAVIMGMMEVRGSLIMTMAKSLLVLHSEVAKDSGR